MIIIITMAGLSKRFKLKGYRLPKFKIVVQEKTLFFWSLSSLKNFISDNNFFIFITLKEHKSKEFIENENAKLKIKNYKIIELNNPTDGQATTALKAKKLIKDSTTPLLIYNIDTYITPNLLLHSRIHGDGWIPCFKAKETCWSFAKVGKNKKVIEVREKERISPYATIGLYYFSSFSIYEKLYKTYYSDPINLKNNEKYIAPLYNKLVKLNKSVYIDEIPTTGVYPLGTPEQIKLFENENCNTKSTLLY